MNALQKLLPRWKIDRNWSLFLDRDGVINVRKPGDYVKTPDEFVFIPGVPDAIAHLNKVFGRILVVTNQQGIGKGLMTAGQLDRVHHYMLEALRKHGGYIDAIYFAPQLAEENHALRKPNTGMAELAREQFPEIDFSRSVMVGDSASDMEFGQRCGMKTIFVNHGDSPIPPCDCVVRSLAELADFFN